MKKEIDSCKNYIRLLEKENAKLKNELFNVKFNLEKTECRLQEAYSYVIKQEKQIKSIGEKK